MATRCSKRPLSSTAIDPRRELEHAEHFARSFDPEAALAASCHALAAAERIHDPALRADAELAVERFAALEQARREASEARMWLHEIHEQRALEPEPEPEPEPRPREPGILARLASGLRAAFSSPRRAETPG